MYTSVFTLRSSCFSRTIRAVTLGRPAGREGRRRRVRVRRRMLRTTQQHLGELAMRRRASSRCIQYPILHHRVGLEAIHQAHTRTRYFPLGAGWHHYFRWRNRDGLLDASTYSLAIGGRLGSRSHNTRRSVWGCTSRDGGRLSNAWRRKRLRCSIFHVHWRRMGRRGRDGDVGGMALSRRGSHAVGWVKSWWELYEFRWHKRWWSIHGGLWRKTVLWATWGTGSTAAGIARHPSIANGLRCWGCRLLWFWNAKVKCWGKGELANTCKLKRWGVGEHYYYSCTYNNYLHGEYVNYIEQPKLKHLTYMA